MSKVVRAINTNAGIRAAYAKRLLKELDAMQRGIARELLAAYGKREDEFVDENTATDASPIWYILKRLRRRMTIWQKRWNIFADWIGPKVIGNIDKQATTSLRNAYLSAGFAVKFQSSRYMNAVTQALIAENVNLIKSIPQQYLNDVEGIVTRGVSMGRDLNFIADELGKRYDITRRRAVFIARDQADKATQAILRTRDQQAGVTEGIWKHLPGKKSIRETHKAMDGKRFPLNEGLFDSAVGRKVLPAELPNCRCTYYRYIPELENLRAVS